MPKPFETPLPPFKGGVGGFLKNVCGNALQLICQLNNIACYNDTTFLC
jgi:hypothetical protein